jgi:hypothetical protein
LLAYGGGVSIAGRSRLHSGHLALCGGAITGPEIGARKRSANIQIVRSEQGRTAKRRYRLRIALVERLSASQQTQNLGILRMNSVCLLQQTDRPGKVLPGRSRTGLSNLFPAARIRCSVLR